MSPSKEAPIVGPQAENGPKIAKISPSGKTFILVLVILIAVVTLAYLYEAGYFMKIPSGNGEDNVPPLTKALVIVSIILTIWLVYLIPSRGLDAAAKRNPERKPDIVMIKGLIRALMLLVTTFAVLSVIFGGLSAILAVVGAFAGMFLGWSLQSPVSGFVAWILVTIKRPFRLGDRVLFPSWGLIGDVMDVGIMYTRLNQVGGTVGGEDKSNREILIPNAILWGNVIINYTSQIAGPSGSEHAGTGRFILDEVIVRITFDSDWEEAERLLLKAAREVTYSIIEESGAEPYVRADLYDYGIYLRLRYMTVAVDRPRISYEISKRIVKSFQASPTVDFAIPYVYSYKTAASEKASP